MAVRIFFFGHRIGAYVFQTVPPGVARRHFYRVESLWVATLPVVGFDKALHALVRYPTPPRPRGEIPPNDLYALG